VKAYLSVCGVYRDEAPYLREWIEFHRLVGVERFFLYDNYSEDEHREVLEPYIENGVVVLHDWPQPIVPRGQLNAYNHCIEHYRNETRWLAIIDVGDNFIFSPTGRPIAEVLTEYEQWPGVGLHWLTFGSSGHRTKPPGLVIESYLRRAEDPQRRLVKAIVEPGRVARVLSDMHTEYTEGFAVDENKEPLEQGLYSKTRSYAKLRLNHYARKSDEENQRRLERWAAVGLKRGSKRTPEQKAQRLRELDETQDEAILVYVPPLRQALAEPAPR
jgi:hypothetical protein